jgi:hypothetical protein
MPLHRNESTNGVVLMIKLSGLFRVFVATGIASGLSPGANAVPIIYDFIGQGSACASSCFEGDFSGTITLEQMAAGPSGDDGTVDEDIGYAADSSGWVNTTFVINWAGNTFAPSAFTGAVTAEQSAIVANGADGDWLETGVFYQNDDPGFDHHEGATFTRYTEDTNWLDDLSFRGDLGLATGPGSFNELNFHSYFYNYTTEEYASTQGTVLVQAMALRNPNSVPEPATPYLLALGLVALLFRRARAG